MIDYKIHLDLANEIYEFVSELPIYPQTKLYTKSFLFYMDDMENFIYSLPYHDIEELESMLEETINRLRTKHKSLMNDPEIYNLYVYELIKNLVNHLTELKKKAVR